MPGRKQLSSVLSSSGVVLYSSQWGADLPVENKSHVQPLCNSWVTEKLITNKALDTRLNPECSSLMFQREDYRLKHEFY